MPSRKHRHRGEELHRRSPEHSLEFLLSEATNFHELGADPKRIRRRIQQLLVGMSLSANRVVVEGITEMVCDNRDA